MIIKFKWVVISETMILLILLGLIVNNYLADKKIEQKIQEGFLSPRIYAGILEPKSHLIVNFKPLKQEITEYIAKNNINASVYVENFRNGAFMGINEKAEFFPASLNKLPVAILIMRDVESGNLSLDQKVQIMDADRTNTSGNLYATKEKELPLRLVLEKLLKNSDNTALRVLLHYVDLEDLQFVLDYYGLDINIEQKKNKQPDLISPKAMSTLFSSLYFSTVLEPKNSEYLLSLLAESEFDMNKIANIPPDLRISHKFGVIYFKNNKFFHDCGILYIEDSRIFYCIMTKNLNEEEALAAISTVVHETFIYVNKTRVKLNKYKT